LARVTGADLGSWNKQWHAYLATRPPDRLHAMLAAGPSKSDKGDTPAYRQQRDRMRLAQLLLSRGRADGALKQLDRLDALGPGLTAEARERQARDPALRWLRGRALEESGSPDQGAHLFGDPLSVLSPFGPWWASRGRWERRAGDENAAGASFVQAVANDPFDAECACEVTHGDPPATIATDASRAALCSAARSWTTTVLDE
jgi:hypothetical protein